ncbi:MAG: hypothetical protein GY750_05695 [Lentisphaerae bacterium]|nr:hypothetical protein [Lentisphaerota bacterium]MCP4100902.1 hypothetical protein [Lentisphaerota bacterium]
MPGRLKLIALAATILTLMPILNSCTLFSSANAVNLTLDFIQTQSTNNGKVFYVVARTDSNEEFTRATSESVYNSFFEENFGTNIFLNPMTPKTVTHLTIKRNQAVSIYFLFTSANSSGWKYRISPVQNDTQYNFVLGQNCINKVTAVPTS